jgi:hypothetical protein
MELHEENKNKFGGFKRKEPGIEIKYEKDIGTAKKKLLNVNLVRGNNKIKLI